jgi:hypothetical protein
LLAVVVQIESFYNCGFEHKVVLLPDSELAMGVFAPGVDTSFLTFNYCRTMKCSNSNLLHSQGLLQVSDDCHQNRFLHILSSL